MALVDTQRAVHDHEFGRRVRAGIIKKALNVVRFENLTPGHARLGVAMEILANPETTPQAGRFLWITASDDRVVSNMRTETYPGGTYYYVTATDAVVETVIREAWDAMWPIGES